MTTEADQGSGDAATSSVLLVGVVLVTIYLIEAVVEAYERLYLSSIGFNNGGFPFLDYIFPSPGYSAVVDWQNILLFEALPFVLFISLAVRRHLDPLSRLIRIGVVALLVGMVVYYVSLVLSAYDLDIANLILTGSYLGPGQVSGPSLQAALSSVLTPVGILYLLANGIIFSALTITGMSFGYFSGESPFWTIKRWLTSREGQPEEETPATVMDDPRSE